jgi:hypothetical protein
LNQDNFQYAELNGVVHKLIREEKEMEMRDKKKWDARAFND